MNKKIITVLIVVAVIIVAFVIANREQTPSKRYIRRETPDLVSKLYEKASALEKRNELLEAKNIYQEILSEYPDFKDISKMQKSLEDVNMQIIFSATQTPQAIMHEVKRGDSLGKIAKQYNTTIELIKKSNGLPSDTIRIGDRLRIWKEEFTLYIDKSQNILLLRSGDEVLKVYNVSTGKNNVTPIGDFTIVDKLSDPVWFKSGAIIPPDSPKNILGTRWMGFDILGYGIHGTTEPETLGQQVTAGCIRMSNDEVEELFSILPRGTKVTIVD